MEKPSRCSQLLDVLVGIISRCAKDYIMLMVVGTGVNEVTKNPQSVLAWTALTLAILIYFGEKLMSSLAACKRKQEVATLRHNYSSSLDSYIQHVERFTRFVDQVYGVTNEPGEQNPQSQLQPHASQPVPCVATPEGPLVHIVV